MATRRTGVSCGVNDGRQLGTGTAAEVGRCVEEDLTGEETPIRDWAHACAGLLRTPSGVSMTKFGRSRPPSSPTRIVPLREGGRTSQAAAAKIGICAAGDERRNGART